ncbi:hypothetical protein N7539_003329 [Penicillium diatomitis]|uniref:N-acetyltransferase domain-containing protein n=1 Tax=Penicillium diatomitis TaxID=2819901 RepID=A0A9W9XGI7_9EURO|nr:uncharacterized protein N7539_003329 [Penicillium diatomitis]KAJ5491762.1 hypothetical protein N7539_003329 [Penicillium diatomitis]
MQALRRWSRLRERPAYVGFRTATFATVQSSHTQTNREVITRLLRLVDSEHQIREYLDEIQSTAGPPLAVIAIDPNALLPPSRFSSTGLQLERLIDSLVFLRRVGLFPVVVHGELIVRAPDTPELEYDRQSEPSRLIRRIRTTNLQISTLLEQRDVETRPLPCSVFAAVAEPDSRERNCQMSDPSMAIADLEIKSIRSAIRADCVPIIATLGISFADSRLHALNLMDTAISLTRELQPSRSILVHPDSPPVTSTGRLAASSVLTKEVSTGSNIVIKTAAELGQAVFNTASSHRSRQGSHSVESVSSFKDFPSEDALRRALERHPDPTVGNNLDHFLSRLEREDFTAYYDYDFTASFPEETIRNLAFVFPQNAFPWQTPSLILPDSNSNELHGKRSHHSGIEVTPELAVFAVSRADWRQGVADKFWQRIRADYGALWGSLEETDPSLSWWRARSTGSFRRRPDDKVFLWHGKIA